MKFPIDGTERFDENKRLFFEQRISIPRDMVKRGFLLDETLAYRLAALYFTVLERTSGSMARIEVERGEISVNTRGLGTWLRFGVGELELTAQRSALRLPIIGGRARARNAGYEGCYIIGAEWDEAGDHLVIFVRIENHAPSVAGLNAPWLRRVVHALTEQPVNRVMAHRFLRQAARDFALSDEEAKQVPAEEEQQP
jgi:hypothetical protein